MHANEAVVQNQFIDRIVLLCTKLQCSIPQATPLFYYLGIPVSSSKILESPHAQPSHGRLRKNGKENEETKEYGHMKQTAKEVCVLRHHNLSGKLTLQPNAC